MSRCGHLQAVGFDECRCDITGLPVDADCDRLTSTSCIPRLALRYRAGTLDMSHATPRTREAIMRTAEEIGDGKLDLDGLSAPELERTIAAAKARLRDLSRGRRRLEPMRRGLGKLAARREAVTAQIEALMADIRRVEEGGAPAAAAPGRRCDRRSNVNWWTPARRAAQAERLRNTMAKRAAAKKGE